MNRNILILSLAFLSSQVTLRAEIPEEIQFALESKDPGALIAIRNSLDTYLNNPDPDTRKAALAISSNAGLEKEHAALILGRITNEGEPEVRASMLRSLVPFVAEDQAISTIVASLLSPPYEVDDAVIIDIGRSIKINDLQPRLLNVLENASTSMRLAALNALLEQYAIPREQAELLENIKSQAAEETTKAKRLTTGMTSVQQTQFLATLPSKQLHDLIEAVHYVDTESGNTAPGEEHLAGPQKNNTAPPEKSDELFGDSTDEETPHTAASPEKPRPIFHLLAFLFFGAGLAVLAGIFFFKNR